jgi:hypothetical protein
MGRYLPRDYEPIPDELLASGADLVDVVRRIARNQNVVWSRGTVLGAFGQEPSPAQVPSATVGTSVRCARFAAPVESRTGSPDVEVLAFVGVSGSTTKFKVRLYQLLPGETDPGPETPYDEAVVTSAPGNTDAAGRWAVSFTARVRGGSSPARFVLDLIGTSGTATLASVSAWWAESLYGMLGESLSSGGPATSQSYVQPDRAVHAGIIAAVSHGTLSLIA